MIIMIYNDYNDSKRFFLNLTELLAGSVVSIIKKEYGSLVHFL